MKKTQRYTRRTSDQMFPLVERYEYGDLPQKEFCEQHGMSSGTFQYWLKKYRVKNTAQETPSFQQIKVLDEQSANGQRYRQIEIRTPSGLEIKIPLD